MQELDNERKIMITHSVMQLMTNWGVSGTDLITLLGMEGLARVRDLKKFTDDRAFPDDPGVWLRIEHLAGISDALRTSYPRNPAMGSRWLNTANQRFENATPMAVMLNRGMEGIIAIRGHLDCAFAWAEDDKRALREQQKSSKT